MTEPADLAQQRLDPAVGAACRLRVELLLHRVRTAPPSERLHRLAQVHASLRALRPVFEAYAAHQIAVQHYASSSTALAMLERDVFFADQGLDGEPEDSGEAQDDAGEVEAPDRSEESLDERLAREDAEWEQRDEEEARAAAQFAALIESVDTDEAREIALAMQPIDPFAVLPAGPWSARFLRVASCQGEAVAAVRLAGPAGAWIVHLAGFTELLGRAALTNATIVPADHGLALQGTEGSLRIRGQTWTERERSAPAPLLTLGRADRAAWVRLIDQIHQRARWDYRIDEWKPPSGVSGLSIRGTSGHYDSGCAIQLTGVTAFDLPHAFHHAVFRLLDPATLPAQVRDADGVALGIEADVSFSDGRIRYVIATAARFEDEGIICEAAALRHEADLAAPPAWPPRPLALVAAARPESAGLRAALCTLLDRSVPGATTDPSASPAVLAVHCVRQALIVLDIGTDYRSLLDRFSASDLVLSTETLAREILAVLSQRAPLVAVAAAGPNEQPHSAMAQVEVQLAAPLAPAPVREAAVRAAQAWLSDALTCLEADAKAAAEADLAFLARVVVAPSKRILDDAQQLAAEAAARRALGLPDRAVALDLDHLTVGRVLFDPVVEAARTDEERLERAAGLLALDAQRSPNALSIARMLPDPAAQARLIAAAPLLTRCAPAIDQLARQLAERARLDVHEVTLLLDGKAEALRLYRLLRAALLGDPAAQ